MNQVIPAISRLLCTLAVLAIVGFVNRPARGNGASADTVKCELNPPSEGAAIEACLARSPRDVELLLELGAAYAAAGRDADARAQYAKAIAIDPNDAEVQRRLEGLR